MSRARGGRAGRIRSQNFEQIKQECLSQGRLFEDAEFPAINSTVYYSYDHAFEWKRPSELCLNPEMFVGGTSRFDVQQGDLGNCWFLAAVASLCASKNSELMAKVVPPDNSLSDGYAGVVHFQIWQYGEWRDVIIDDRLPTQNGRLMFMHSVTQNEFWSPLLEKAYAKLCGSYEALQGGSSAEAMEDFTGGVCETFNFRKKIPDGLATIVMQAQKRKSLMGCTIDASPDQIEDVLPNGLVMGHAYSITGFRQLHIKDTKINLIRVRNPWGNQYEWRGAWGDNSSEWQLLSDSEKQRMGLERDDDGEFWMTLDDFTSNFDKMEICFLTPGTMDEMAMQGRKSWEATKNDGSWITRVSAGGCRNFLDTFWTNPQFKVEVMDADEDDDENMGTLIVALLQKERRKKRKEGLDLLTIGYMIYKVEDPNCGILDMNFFKYNQAVARSPVFSNMREVCGRHRLAPGHYVIIPCTFKPHQEGEFLMRIFTEREAKASELDEATGMMADDEDSMIIHVGRPEMDAQNRRRRVNAVTSEDVDQEKAVRELFKKAAGEDMEVDAYDLREILNSQFTKEFKFEGFQLETCRSMVAMRDYDHSGTLGYEEFKTLWKGLRQWKKIFKEFDRDNSCTFNSFELREALNSAGIRVSNSVFNCLVMRYSDREGRLFFNDFVLCAVRLRTTFAVYESKIDSYTGDARFKLDQYVQAAMYA